MRKKKIQIKASALQRLAAKEGLLGEIIANTLARNIRSQRDARKEFDTWLIIDECCEPIIQKLLEEKKVYKSEVRR